ncbi:EAL domain-containing protein [Shewanella salipaludis]|uniref:EAL domain-containing protein n=1 Tax=Shewanella salipaludis TaxID=2723052 RepID=A0A972G530_9GAMM|nr:EAL domain-containing protein [Shewanella salipaludis]NMH64605.1 EAL domain-containing protein [Shewanella salipaludis]
MERALTFFLTKLSFRQQLISTFTLGIILLAAISSFVISKTSQNTIEAQYVQQGHKLTLNFAHQSTLALLYHSVESAEDAAKITLSFPDIVGIALYDKSHQPLLLTGRPPLPGKGRFPTVENTIVMRETAQEWDFSTPVYSSSDMSADTSPFTVEEPSREIIGYAHVIKSKKNLLAMSQDILQTNMLTAGLLAGLLLLFLLLITNRVIRPIKILAKRMREAETGDYGVRAQLQGPSDILHMEQAFNTMMNELEARQQELERARDSALSSALLKGQFVASISHELRTPMNSILGMMELIDEQGLTEKARHYLKIANTSGVQLLRLIDDILDFSKLESAKVHLSFEAFDLAELIADVVELLNVQASAKHLLLGAFLDPQLPTRLSGDAGRLRQVLINLLGNALKFTQSGGISVTASLLERLDKEVRLKLEVADTGIGIEESAQRIIFQAFTQADGSTTRLYGGTGLGLAISRQLVSLMGGELGVQSTVGAGSHFWFTLSLNTEAQADDTMPIPPAPLPPLLLLQGNACLNLLPERLAQSGYDVDTAYSAEQALQMMRDSVAKPPPYPQVLICESAEMPVGAHFYHSLEAEFPAILPQTLVLSHDWHQPRPSRASRLYFLPLSLGYPQLRALLNSSLASESIQPEAKAQARPLKTSHEARPGDEGLQQAQILVVEDNRANQYVASAMLEKLGYRAIIAANGREALQLLSEQEVSLIFMDCHMPVMDGYEATQNIRKREGADRHTPIIAMTADVKSSDRDKCFDVGMDDYLAKPLTLAALTVKLQLWLGSPATTDNRHREAEVSMTHTPGAIDKAVLSQLREETGKTFPSLVMAYLEDTPGTLSQLAQAIAQQDKQKIKDYSHLLKGSSATLGASGLAHDAKRLEATATAKAATEALQQELLQRLNLAFNRVAQLLSAEIDTPLQPASQGGTANQELLSLSSQPYVLIVDDDRSTRLSLKGCLEQDSYYIAEAQNGAIALSVCEQRMPDLILMDAMMKEMNGFDAMRKILQLPMEFKPPILMLTASDKDEVIEQAFEYGATDFIAKPVNLHVLRKRVAQLIRTTLAERHIHQLAYHDQLTGLANRTQFLERIEEAITQAESAKEQLALMFIDLDKFKFINDTQGHDVGDMLLKAVAKRINHCVRSGDLVSRLGGDEFTVLLEDIQSTAVASKIGQKICALLAEPFTFMGKIVRAPVSVGISVYPADGEDYHALMKHADTAMYSAKAGGGNKIQFYEYGMEAELIRRIELERDLRHALEHNELVLHFQPQIELRTGKLLGAEALVRWEHPERGFMPPDEFISLAEESGLILPLGEWVLNQSCRQFKLWLEAGLDLHFIAVNISGQQMKHSYLLQKVKSCLNTHKLDAKYLQLEITESVMAEESETCLSLLNGLKELGVSLAIDDFGTGYSSLSYLIKFPVDTLKIDRSFIHNIPNDKDSETVASGIIALAHKLSMQVIAEGVETQEQRDFLLREQCDSIQGYLISRPLARDEFETWLHAYKPHKLPK